MGRQGTAGVLCLLALFFAGCGGGGNGGPPPAPTASLTVNGLATATVQLGQTAMLAWSCMNATSANASATPAQTDWTGSQTLSGTKSVSPTPTGTITYTMTCSGSGGSTPAQVTVTVSRVIAITGVAPFTIDCGVPGCIFPSVEIDGSGFMAGDKFSFGLFGTTNLIPGTAANKIFFQNLAFDSAHYSPGAFPIQVCAPDGSVCSNTMDLLFDGNLDEWALTTADEVQFDPVSGSVCKFKVADGSADGCLAGMVTFGIAGDGNDFATVVPKTGSASGSIGVLDATTGRVIFLPGDGADGTFSPFGISLKNGMVSATQPAKGLVSFWRIDQFGSIATSTAAGANPGAVSMSSGCGGTDAFVYDEEGTQLLRFSVASAGSGISIQPKGSVTLNGFSPASQFGSFSSFVQKRYVVTWDSFAGIQPVPVLSSCSAGVVAPVFLGSNPDGTPNLVYKLAFVDGNTMTQTGDYVTLPANYFRAAPDPSGAVLVAVANAQSRNTGFARVTLTQSGGQTTANLANLTSTTPPGSGFYAVAVGVVQLPDGTTRISAGMRAGTSDTQHMRLPNQ